MKQLLVPRGAVPNCRNGSGGGHRGGEGGGGGGGGEGGGGLPICSLRCGKKYLGV